MKTMYIVTVVVLNLLIAGCSKSGDSKKPDGNAMAIALAKELDRGFASKECRFLFVADYCQSWEKWLRGLAYDDMGLDILGDIEHTSDGKVLRLWNTRRSQAIIIEDGVKPRVIDTPPDAFVDRQNRPVLWYGQEHGEADLPDGTVLQFPCFKVDADGRYVCVGGRYFDYATNSRKEAPITIRATSQPAKVLVTSQMTGDLRTVFFVNHKLYACVHGATEGNKSPQVRYEVYREEGHSLVLEKQSVIDSPAKFAAWVDIQDICPEGKHFLLWCKRELPLESVRYLLDVDTGRLEDLGNVVVFTGFLDRHVFDTTLSRQEARPSDPN